MLKLDHFDAASPARSGPAIAVFAANEAHHLEPCLRALAAASSANGCQVSFVLNGTTDDSVERLRGMVLPAGMQLRVWHIPRGDKANAINVYLHELGPASSHHILMDAYIQVEPGALAALGQRLADDPHAHVACGVPRNGRSAAWMTQCVLEGGTINGNLYALRDDFVRRVVERGWRLPLGIYRTDPLLGSMAANDFDGVRHDWDPSRIVGVAQAGYRIRPLSALRPGDILRQIKREMNQTRGVIESVAVRDVILRGGYGALPPNAHELLSTWLDANVPPRPDRWLHRAMMPLVLRRLRAAPPCFEPGELRATLAFTRSGG